MRGIKGVIAADNIVLDIFIYNPNKERKKEMENIFHKLKYAPICDIRGCGNKAKYGIGHEQFPSEWLNLCSECAKKMMFEASVHMDEDLTEMASEYAREKVLQQIEEEASRTLESEKKKIIEEQEKKEAERRAAMLESYIDPNTQPLKEGDLEVLEKTVEIIDTNAALQKAINRNPDMISKAFELDMAFIENANGIELGENKNDTSLEYYVCKYCGEKFEKPAEMGVFRRHSASCYKKHPERHEKIVKAGLTSKPFVKAKPRRKKATAGK